MRTGGSPGAGERSTLATVMVDAAVPGRGRPLSRARTATLVSLASGMAATLLLPAAGLAREPEAWRLASGALGLAAFA
ncbi:hypothetical protein [Micromonospora sp. NPDC049799]|uniref:hypothetical protein n=1 Tax=Micromonospora sp. NPDC049799 TaxID=3154741 RepID=UPI0033EFF03B